MLCHWQLVALLKNPKDWGRNKKTPQHIVCNPSKEHDFLANIGVFQQNRLSASGLGEYHFEPKHV
jgi:hypothetical protein